MEDLKSIEELKIPIRAGSYSITGALVDGKEKWILTLHLFAVSKSVELSFDGFDELNKVLSKGIVETPEYIIEFKPMEFRPKYNLGTEFSGWVLEEEYRPASSPFQR